MHRHGGIARPHRRSCFFALAFAGVFFATAPAAAQDLPFGIGEDASLIPRGALRFTVNGTFAFSDELRRADGTRVPLGASLGGSAFGAREIPGLAAAEQSLGAASGLPSFRLNIGRVDASAAVSITRLPMSLEYGVTRWLTLAVSAPLVRRHVDVAINPNAGEASGNVGLNPAFDSSTVAGRGALNAARAFNNDFARAEAEFRTAYAACLVNASGAGCAQVLADPALGSASAQARQAIVAVYGGGSAGALSPFVPLSGSGVQAAIVARVDELRARFESLRAAGAPIAAPAAGAPAGTPFPVGAADFDSFVTSPERGLGAAPLVSFTRTNIGDLDVSARISFHDGFRADATGVRLRSAATATYRVGAGPSRNANDFLDPGAGDGQNDLELRFATDVAVGRRWSATAIAGQTWQRPDRQTIRAGAALFLDPSTRRRVQRDLGDVTAFDLIPRVAITRALAVAGTASFRRKTADRYDGGTPDAAWGLVAPPSGAFSHVRAGVGFVFSTRESGRGLGPLPIELAYQHARTVRTSGATSALVDIDQIGGRIFWTIWR